MERNRVLMMEKTVEIYLDHAKAIMAIIPVIEAFDGKVINKRLDTEMCKVLPSGQSARWVTEFGRLNIKLHNSNNGFPCGNHWEYTGNREYVIRCGEYKTVFATTANGNWRINAAPIADALKHEIDRIHERAKAIMDAIDNAGQIEAEAQEAVSALTAFNKKYSYEVLELMGVYFSVQNLSKDKNYSIKY